MSRGSSTLVARVLGATLVSFAAPAVADGPVVALRGEVLATLQGQERRLACHELVRSGETLASRRPARAAFLSADVYAEFPENTELRLGVTDAGGPAVRLADGRARVVDTRGRDAADPLRLATPWLEAEGVRNDTEAWAIPGRLDGHSTVCERDRRLSVRNLVTGEGLLVEPGECLTVSANGATLRRAHTPRPLAVAHLGLCEQGELVGPLALLFSPTDVAAAPPLTAFPDPLPVLGVPREPCDDPGVVCGARLVVVEQPPVTGGAPGATSR